MFTLAKVAKVIKQLKSKEKHWLWSCHHQRTIWVTLRTFKTTKLHLQLYVLIWQFFYTTNSSKDCSKPAEEIASYRPISLLPITTMTFETLLKASLERILEFANVIPKQQFRFWAKSPLPSKFIVWSIGSTEAWKPENYAQQHSWTSVKLD